MSNLVNSVTVTIDGTPIVLESQDGLTWTKTAIAPTASSHNLTGGYYPLTVTATYETGTTTTVSGTSDTTDATYDATLSPQCRLVVKETYRPTINIISPTNNAYFKTATQSMEIDIVDNANGQATGYSGVDPSTITVTIVSVKLNQSLVLGYSELAGGNMISNTTGGFKITGTKPFDDSDDWTIAVNAADYDGNNAVATTVSFTIDTEAPMLSVSSPVDNFKTANSTLTISGTTNDSSSGAVTVSVTVDGNDFGTIPVQANGSFSGTITLTGSGDKVIVITATDVAGNSTPITRNVFYSSDAPTIKSVTMVPNPVDGGQTYIITVVTE